jgi:acyl carrier protein
MNEHKAELEQILSSFWDSNEVPIDGAPNSTDQLGAALDSITAVEVLLEVDTLFKRKIPVEAVIQRGGYQDKQEFVTKLCDQILKVVEGGKE